MESFVYSKFGNFSKSIRNRFFPVYSGEFTKFTILATLCFLVCLNFTMLRNIKDTLVIADPEIGINAIPFLRTWFLLPLMFVLMKIYAWLSTRFTQDKVTYILLSFFLIYFILFISLFYPLQTYFRWDSAAEWVAKLSPRLKPMGDALRYWSYSIYYCLGEIWGVVVILILFWGTSNRSTTREEASRFYSPIILITNMSGIIASQIALSTSHGNFTHDLFPSMSKWDATLTLLTIIVCVVTMLSIFFFFIYHRAVLERNNTIEKQKEPLPKEEMSLSKIIDYVIGNPKFRPLIVMVFAYFFCNGVMEFVWKYYLHKLYPTASDFNDFLNFTSLCIGISATLISLLVTSELIRRFSWQISALVTPILLLFPLTLIIANNTFIFSQTDYLKITVYLSAFYYILNRMCKFTFFDLSKEVASVEFSINEQIKAKTVLDGMVPNIARTSESIYLQFILLLTSSLETGMLLILPLIFIVHLAWGYSIRASNPSPLYAK